MKTLKYYIPLLWVSVLFILQSCYKDKGNYDYTEISKVVIDQDYDIPESSASQMITQDDTLKIIPLITLNGIKEGDLEYLWDCALQNTQNPQFTELSRERDLNIKCTLQADKYDLRFKVTDKHTGVSTYAYYNLTVNSITARCILLLCKEGPNEYDIYTCPIDATRGSIVYQIGKKMYSARNGHMLKDAVKLVYWNNISSESLLWALQTNGGETLSGFDLTKHGDASEWFFETPAVIRPTNIYGDINGREYFLLSDEGVHMIDNELAPPFKASLKAGVSDGTTYNIEEAAYLQTNKARRYAFWDKQHSRFLQWDYSAGCLKPFDAVDLEAKPNSFDPNQMSGMTPLCFGSYDGGRYNPACSYNFFKGNDGQVHLFTFKGSATTIEPDQHRIIDAAVGLGEADCMAVFSYYDMIYYAKDNTIFVFDPNSPVSEHHAIYTDEDQDIRFTGMHCNYDFATLYVSARKGDKDYVYRLYVTSSGDLSQPTTARPEVVQKVGPYPEIVNMEMLFKNY